MQDNRGRSAVMGVGALLATLLMFTSNARAAIVPPVLLGTSAGYSVLAGSTVTNTNASVLRGSLGLWPGTAVTGFPPGIVVPPATMDVTNPAAQLAQSDLTTAYVDARDRELTATVAADLTNLVLPGGVYAGPDRGALQLSGPLVLDGAGDPASVFIFQTRSTLTTASASTVRLINGAQECNVFWQVGSSATLGTDSVFVGSILALASVTVNNGVTIRGRALARTGAVTMDEDDFTPPTCATTTPTTSTLVTATTAPTTSSSTTSTTSTATTSSTSTTSTTARSTTSTLPGTTSSTVAPTTSSTLATPSATSTTATVATTGSTPAGPAALPSGTAASAGPGALGAALGLPAPPAPRVTSARASAPSVALTTTSGPDAVVGLPRSGSPVGRVLQVSLGSFAVGLVAFGLRVRVRRGLID